jgi:hypothetical protein
VAKRDHNRPSRQRISQSAEKELLRREQEARRDLDQLIDLLAKAAVDAASDDRLSETDRQFLKRQQQSFSGSAAELMKLLADHPYPHDREHRLRTLFWLLGSTCIIARNRLVDPIKNRLGTIAATRDRTALTPKIDEIIASEAKAVRQRRPDFSDNEIARHIKKRVNELIAEAAAIAGVKKIQLGQRAIGVRLKKISASSP